MNQKEEQNEINALLNNMYLIIKTTPYKTDHFVDFQVLIKKVHDIQNKDLLRTCYNNQGIDLIALICRYNKKKLLMYILHESHIMHYFTWENKDLEITFREHTFYYAMCLNQFEIIEILYDYWTGDLHWLGHKMESNKLNVQNLHQLNATLNSALLRYETWILSKLIEKRKINQNMLFNVQSLMAFSEFQEDLYCKLSKLKEELLTFGDAPVETIRLRETYAIQKMILVMLDCYNLYIKKPESITQNSVYENVSEFNDFIELPKDTSKIMRKTYFYVIFEVFFRKLDYNVCLLLLDNLHSLKLRLLMPQNAYQKLESKLYQFVYHVSSKWSLYIPIRKKMINKTFPGKHNNIDCQFSYIYNAHIFEKGIFIIYLERRDFEHALNIFKNELQNRNIEENIRNNKIELLNEEVNSLVLLPELRDLYSLKKMSHHIAQLYRISNKGTKEYFFLLIERSLQVVGEFLKTTNESLHLQPTTEALVEAEISVEVVNDLKNLRDLLCHVKDSELLKRIEIEVNNNDIYKFIFMELIYVKKKMDEVIMIYKPLVKRVLILNGLSLIENRKNEMPCEVEDMFIATRRVRLFPQNEPYCELLWVPEGYTDEFMTQVKLLVEHSLQLESKLTLVNKNIHKNLIRKFFIYKETINGSLQKIKEVKENWQLLCKSLKDKIPSIVLSEYPNENDFNKIKTYSKKIGLGSDYLHRLVEDNTLFAYAENHWKFIKKILEFIILKTQIKQYTPVQLETVTQELKTLDYKNNDMEKIIGNYLLTIEKKIKIVLTMEHQNQRPGFIAITELRCKLTMANFLIQEEKNYLIDTLENIKTTLNVRKKNKMKIEKMIANISKDCAIPKTEYTGFIKTIILDGKAQKILLNLVMGYKRDPMHEWCLSKRIALLRKITKGQSVDNLKIQYKFDKSFRILLEVLIFDVLEILACTKNTEVAKKSSKLLTEINLRNILIHGSPLLEIVGNILDSNDLPVEMISKALELLNEERSINGLLALKDLGFDFRQISSNSLSPEEDALVTELKTSARWKDYLVFIPELKQLRQNKKKINEIEKNLLQAVNADSTVLVQQRINEGLNVDHVYNCKHALIHYAAIKGSVEVLKVLLTNKVNVNNRSKCNMTALHYTAMNGYIDATDLLLKNGADNLALDDNGRTPTYLAGQRKHDKICSMLAHAIKK